MSKKPEEIAIEVIEQHFTEARFEGALAFSIAAALVSYGNQRVREAAEICSAHGPYAEPGDLDLVEKEILSLLEPEE